MLYTISHSLCYTYDRPIQLDKHTIRLQPRSEVCQTLKSFQLQINPPPERETVNLDLDGNSIQNIWFSSAPIAKLQLQMQAVVETHRVNPFDFLLERWAVHLPIDYPISLHGQLSPYFETHELTGSIQPNVIELAEHIHHLTDGNTTAFLSELNQTIHSQCSYAIRETGNPFPPGITWSKKSGSCRDFAVLFMEVCRAVGLGARFVSGYHEGDPEAKDSHLHAWVEVYLPGAGWRGYDPTLGLAVSDRHIALAASPWPNYAAPVVGHLQRGSNATSTMSYRLSIQLKE